jgi:excisionase family DNA binding protein
MEVLTVREVAEILRVAIRTVRELIKAKKLKAVRVGKEYRILKSELERFLGQEEEDK